MKYRAHDHRRMKKRFRVALLCVGMALANGAEAASEISSGNFPTPKGLSPCAQNDPVAVAEAHIASNMGGEFLNCFRSERRVAVQSPSSAASAPFASAFAIRVAGNGHTPAEVDKLFSTVNEQWKGSLPLGGKLSDDYVARLNAMMKGTNIGSTISSVKPTLVSIRRLDAKSYIVVSIRAYVVGVSGQQVGMTKVNADAIVLRGGSLIRLTMQQMLTGASDAEKLQNEISDWVRAIEAG